LAGGDGQDAKTDSTKKKQIMQLEAGIEKRDGGGTGQTGSTMSGGDHSNKNKSVRRIGVHCLAGLGRAPFFVALALVNNGCSP
jgi:protein tyrosine phosphatase